MTELLALFVLSALSGTLVLRVLGRLDRHRADKRTAGLAGLFTLVGALSVLPSFLLYDLSPWWFHPAELAASPLWQSLLFIWLVNAPVEELAKFLCFVAAVTLARSIREPQDGALQGAQVGLGFALVENFLYGLDGGWELLLLRSFISLPGHMVYGAVWGGYFGYEVYRGKGRVARWTTPALALVPAVFSHALFNTLATLRVELVWNLLADGLTLAFGVFLYRRLQDTSPYRKKRPWRDWARAIPELEHALAVHPDAVLLRQRLAGYYLASGNTARALSELELVEPLAPGDRWTAFFRTAALAREAGRTSFPGLPPEAALDPGLFRALSGWQNEPNRRKS